MVKNLRTDECLENGLNARFHVGRISLYRAEYQAIAVSLFVMGISVKVSRYLLAAHFGVASPTHHNLYGTLFGIDPPPAAGYGIY
ncbi:hypothetical protein [Bifidobacterium sp. ESL0790]|uniref:hypothetical protein n=1 Tax=Bifidobacterium sp. ESL0790 TaxID=2983233 RepID=UPI0023FA1DE6|nr:hypothetical protein [Bifidobacterium sp. ESL0790]WEV72630.1 hypothetical protein OZY47_01180 [Bifidobacterium sp. ESL0790]